MSGLAAVTASLMMAAPPVLEAAFEEMEHLGEDAPPAGQGLHTRILRYPEATEEGSAPPRLRLMVPGSPVALYFPDQTLDSRAELHFVNEPHLLSLRVAERTVFVKATGAAEPGQEILATITLSGGRPLNFLVRVVGPRVASDASVEVRTTREASASCAVELAETRDELAECRESSGERAIGLIAGLLIEAPADTRPVERRSPRFRDKQNRMYVEVVDAVRLYEHTYVRVRIENRDGSRRAWVAGDVTVTVIGPGPRRRPLGVVSIFERPVVETGESTLLVLGLETPQMPTGSALRLAVHEEDGQRHVVIEPLRI